MKKSDINIKLEIHVGVSFWDCVKLRIAGQNFKPVIDELVRQLKKGSRAKA